MVKMFLQANGLAALVVAVSVAAAPLASLDWGAVGDHGLCSDYMRICELAERPTEGDSRPCCQPKLATTCHEPRPTDADPERSPCGSCSDCPCCFLAPGLSLVLISTADMPLVEPTTPSPLKGENPRHGRWVDPLLRPPNC